MSPYERLTNKKIALAKGMLLISQTTSLSLCHFPPKCILNRRNPEGNTVIGSTSALLREVTLPSVHAKIQFVKFLSKLLMMKSDDDDWKILENKNE